MHLWRRWHQLWELMDYVVYFIVLIYFSGMAPSGADLIFASELENHCGAMNSLFSSNNLDNLIVSVLELVL